MNRKIFGVFVLSAMLVLSLGYVQAQITGFIPVFVDELGNEDASVIFQSPTGNIGIETTSPLSKLEVSAPNSAIGVGAALGAGQATGLQFLNWGTQHAGLRWSQGSNNLTLEDASSNNDPTSWYSGNAVNFIVRNGRVGIGTTSPLAPLHVVGANPTTGFALRIDQASPNGDGLLAYVNTTSATRTVFTAASNVAGLEVKGDGRVSIGGTPPNFARAQLAVRENGTNSAGVLGTTTNGIGVWGTTMGGFGVIGESSGTGVGVLGRNSANGIGVEGISTNGPGVVGGTGGIRAGVEGYAGTANTPGVLAHSVGNSPQNLGLLVWGRFQATGTKSAVVPLQDGQHISLYAEESTEVWFSDYGSVQLADGQATVQIDPEFLQTVNTDKDYHVFLTARGNPVGSLYIDHETPSSFEIRETTGTANIKVSYRIVAKRKDFAEERLKKVASPEIESMGLEQEGSRRQ